VRAAGAEPVRGDLDDAAALAAGAAGCDVVFHAAAIVADWGDHALFERVNVAGTRQMLAAARAAGVPRFVHVSTEAVLAGPDPIRNATEKTPKPRAPYGPYARTKSMAEDLVCAASSPGFATVVVRPRFVWGCGDTSVLPQLLAAVRAGRFRWIDRGDYLTSATHVRNAVEGLILAAEHGRPGEIYFVTDGPPLPFRTFITRILETQGVRPGARSLPRRVAWRLGVVVEAVWRTFRIRAVPPISRMVVKMMGEEVTIDDGKARRELGYVGRVSFEDGIREMAAAARAAPAPDAER
jgi:nucleoside-diphosphate-sugar epimerase